MNVPPYLKPESGARDRALATRLDHAPKRRATPFYQFMSQRFGADQTLLSTWPIATYCFLRAFETRGLAWSAGAGAAAALAMLGSYYSVFLIAGFVAAVLAHPGRRTYVRSASPWLSGAPAALVPAPHVHWLL